MYEYFEHTADLGIRVAGRDLPDLFEESARALFQTIVADLKTIEKLEEVVVALPKDDYDYLLFDWLKALLYHFDVDGLVFGDFRVTIDDNGLRGVAWGEPTDRKKHDLEHEVKAITYHGLFVEQTDSGWNAEIIVDI